jgi:hypothetical protein
MTIAAGAATASPNPNRDHAQAILGGCRVTPGAGIDIVLLDEWLRGRSPLIAANLPSITGVRGRPGSRGPSRAISAQLIG